MDRQILAAEQAFRAGNIEAGFRYYVLLRRAGLAGQESSFLRELNEILVNEEFFKLGPQYEESYLPSFRGDNNYGLDFPETPFYVREQLGFTNLIAQPKSISLLPWLYHVIITNLSRNEKFVKSTLVVEDELRPAVMATILVTRIVESFPHITAELPSLRHLTALIFEKIQLIYSSFEEPQPPLGAIYYSILRIIDFISDPDTLEYLAKISEIKHERDYDFLRVLARSVILSPAILSPTTDPNFWLKYFIKNLPDTPREPKIRIIGTILGKTVDDTRRLDQDTQNTVNEYLKEIVKLGVFGRVSHSDFMWALRVLEFNSGIDERELILFLEQLLEVIPKELEDSKIYQSLVQTIGSLVRWSTSDG